MGNRIWKQDESFDARVKILALYLPQFHNIPENDEWWGDGFTEWTNVRSAIPLFPGHIQPKHPMGGNYYDLMDSETQLRQVELAKQYGIYGFCYYHYWFGENKLLLEKPMERMLANQSLDLPFCVCWANEDWSKAWVGDETTILIKQKYGDVDEWRRHYLYLRPFFSDDRYIKRDGKPLFIVYRYEFVPEIESMIRLWNEWAIADGLSGIHFACKLPQGFSAGHALEIGFNSIIEWQPSQALANLENEDRSKFKKARRGVADWIHRSFGIDVRKRYAAMKDVKAAKLVDYETVWEKILSMNPDVCGTVPGAYCKWDNTPRHGIRGSVHINASPEKFERYLERQIIRARDIYHSDFIVMFAWNEWAEGGYLEPDEEDAFGYLQAVKGALIATGQWPVSRKDGA